MSCSSIKTPESKSTTTTTTPRSVSDVSATSDSSTALLQLLSPDGYYAYLQISKPAAGEAVEEELVKKNFRRLSLKHHPDRRSGDTETFRVLKRAQVVLLNPKLREQYDLLGLDLDDEEEHHNDDDDNKKEQDENAPPPAPETFVSHMATSALAAIMQMGVRTAMMGAVSVFLCKWRITVFPALAFLAFIAYKIVSTTRQAPNSGASYWDLVSPLTIATGLVFLHKGRNDDMTWSYMFWVGEAMVMTMFTINSLSPTVRTPGVYVGLSISSLVLSLWLRGQFWRYTTVVVLIGIVAMLTAMAFPLMELLLEEIVKQKLQKVGEKVRAHNQRMQEYYTTNGGINNTISHSESVTVDNDKKKKGTASK